MVGDDSILFGTKMKRGRRPLGRFLPLNWCLRDCRAVEIHDRKYRHPSGAAVRQTLKRSESIGMENTPDQTFPL